MTVPLSLPGEFFCYSCQEVKDESLIGGHSPSGKPRCMLCEERLIERARLSEREATILENKRLRVGRAMRKKYLKDPPPHWMYR